MDEIIYKIVVVEYKDVIFFVIFGFFWWMDMLIREFGFIIVFDIFEDG